MSGALLDVEIARVMYGLVPALSDVRLQVEAKQIVAILGPNGAGKTSLLKGIVGAVPTAGRTLRLGGIDRSHAATWRLAHLGLVLVPDGGRCFPQLTVAENLEVVLTRANPEQIGHMWDLFPQLQRRAGSRAGTLSGGERQMLAIARGLLLDPKVLLLDEPSSGLAPVVVDEVYRAISELQRRSDIAIVIAEQNVHMAMALSANLIIMQGGRILREGPTSNFSRSELEAAYLEAG